MDEKLALRVSRHVEETRRPNHQARRARFFRPGYRPQGVGCLDRQTARLEKTGGDGVLSLAATTTTRSTDGTAIAYESCGDGPPLILVDGALCYRKMGPSHAFAEVLREHFTVIRYDRRGRGESADTARYSVEREIEDLAALIEAAGGSAYVCGFSSGAVLALTPPHAVYRSARWRSTSRRSSSTTAGRRRRPITWSS